jgi:mono/diheme cytochrome c family protein
MEPEEMAHQRESAAYVPQVAASRTPQEQNHRCQAERNFWGCGTRPAERLQKDFENGSVLRILVRLKKLYFMGLAAVAGLCACSPGGSGPAPASTLTEQLSLGKSLYARTCAQCHYDGTSSPIAPPLRGSDVLAQPPAALARVILGGRKGESMRGNQKFNGVMPPQQYLSDAEVASVVAYVRETFGSRREKVSLEDVAEVRASLRK